MGYRSAVSCIEESGVLASVGTGDRPIDWHRLPGPCLHEVHGSSAGITVAAAEAREEDDDGMTTPGIG
jgi:hypothetical protein